MFKCVRSRKVMFPIHRSVLKDGPFSFSNPRLSSSFVIVRSFSPQIQTYYVPLTWDMAGPLQSQESRV